MFDAYFWRFLSIVMVCMTALAIVDILATGGNNLEGIF